MMGIDTWYYCRYLLVLGIVGGRLIKDKSCIPSPMIAQREREELDGVEYINPKHTCCVTLPR